MVEEVTIRFNAEGKAEVEIKKVEKELKKLEKSTEEVGKTFKNVFETAAGVAIGVGFNKALGLAGRGLRSFIGIFEDGIAAAQVQQDAINQLNTALVTNGQFTEETSKDLQEFASALQETTTVGDETTLQLLALSQAFGFSAEQSKVATEAAINLAAAAGISLEEATRRVGRTISGSTADVAKFAAGINDLTKEELAAGKAAEVLLKALGGTAQAQINTFSGAVQQAKNNLGDLSEELGFIITNNAQINDIIQETSKFFKELTTVLGENKDGAKELASEGVFLLASSFALLVKSVVEFLRVANELGKAYDTLVNGSKAANALVIENRIRLLEARNASGKYTEAIAKLRIELDKAVAKTREQAEENKRQNDLFKSLDESANKFQKRLQELREESDPTSIKNRNAELEKQSELNRKNAASTKALTEEQKKQNEAAKALTVELGTDGTDENRLKAESALLEEQRAAQLITEQQFLMEKEQLLRDAQVLEEERLRTAAETNQQIAENLDDSIAASKERLETRVAKLDAKRTDNEKKEAQRRVQAQKEALTGIATLQSSNNKTLFNIGKAAALATATVDGIQSIQKTAAAFPFPFNIPFVAAQTAAQAANIAKIASAKPPGLQGGIDAVPPGFENDSFAAFLASGERVVPAQTNQDLTAFLEGRRNTDALLVELIGAVRTSGNVSVNVGGETVTEVVRRELESGGTLAVEA